MRSKIYFPEQRDDVGIAPYLGFGTGSRPLLLFIVPFLDGPLARVIFNIFPNLVIILLIADHMVIIGTLEDSFSNFLGC